MRRTLTCYGEYNNNNACCFVTRESRWYWWWHSKGSDVSSAYIFRRGYGQWVTYEPAKDIRYAFRNGIGSREMENKLCGESSA